MEDKENKKEEVKKQEEDKLEENKVEEKDVNNKENDKELDDDSYEVTREINLDDLYDGSINNTVVIDPVTNKEILMKSKKPNYTILGVFLAVLILLLLYYLNNKSSFGMTTTDVEPNTTVSTTKDLNSEYGTLNCTYKSSSDAESQEVVYTANFENSKLTTTIFNYVVTSNVDTTSDVYNDLKSQYETFFINNASQTGNTVRFESSDSSFNFSVQTDYEVDGFDALTLVDGQTILYVKPSTSDTIESLQEAYVNKGFSCTINNESES